MKPSTKYIGLDVHQATTMASVCEESGRAIAQIIVPTEEQALLFCHSSVTRMPSACRMCDGAS